MAGEVNFHSKFILDGDTQPRRLPRGRYGVYGPEGTGMELVAALKAFGVVLAGVVAWLAIAAAALEIVLRVTATPPERGPAPSTSGDAHPVPASAAMRSAASGSRR